MLKRWSGPLVCVLPLLMFAHGQLSMDPKVLITETVPASDGTRVPGIIADDVTLNCFVENKPDYLEVRWQMTKYNDQGQAQGTVSIAKDQASDDVNKWSIEKPTPFSWRLRVKALQIGDQGTYSCFLQLNIDTKVLANRTVVATDPPRIIEAQTSTNMQGREGDRMALTCNASGRPKPTLMWRREGNAILPGGGVIRFQNKLDIRSMHSSHRGRYFCEAVNEVGKAVRAITLNVQFSPKINVDADKVGQAPGYKRTLICYIDSNPRPSTDPTTNQLAWIRDSRLIASSDRIYSRTLEGARGMLTFELVFDYVTEEDYGVYSCRAKSTMGSDTEAIQLYKTDTWMPDKGIYSSGTLLNQTVIWTLLTTLVTYYVCI